MTEEQSLLSVFVVDFQLTEVFVGLDLQLRRIECLEPLDGLTIDLDHHVLSFQGFREVNV